MGVGPDDGLPRKRAAAPAPRAPATIRAERERSISGAVRHCTKGPDLRIPALPLESGAELRLELHDGAGACVASSFSDPSVNDGYRYHAETE